MNSIMNIIKEFSGECPCGRKHETSVRDVRIGSGLVSQVGSILKENGFSDTLLLVADRNTLKAADGIIGSLDGFRIEYKIYDEIRVADMKHVEELESMIAGRDISVLSVGTGSVNDPCRLACARQDKKLCIFGTAPSMDGFASYSSPIVKDGFKASYPAKSPEVIIGDTKILAAAPSYLKSAGFGDMIAKYVGLIDWRISSILTGEYYCERVARLTRNAVDALMALADRVTCNDEETAGKIFEALLMTGIGMSFTQNSRPASGSEHIIAHLIECLQLPQGIIPNYHGEDVGVATLEMLEFYNELADYETIKAHRETVDWKYVYSVYGDMADEVRKLNTPTTCADEVEPEILEQKWSEIRDIIHSVPSYDECLEAMKKAGCKLTYTDIGKSQALFDDCLRYAPYMRRRITLHRLYNMIETTENPGVIEMDRIAPLYNNVKVNCTIVSDTHIDIKHPMPWIPKNLLKSALKDAQFSKSPVDAFIVIGDTTSRGQQVNWEMAEECFAEFDPAKRILLAIGNHDLWHDDDFDRALSEYKRYSERICSVKRDTTYFSEIINGYHFIFIGSDSDAGCEAQISDEQMEWFENAMKSAGESGKPIFVFCHQSLNQKHGLPRTWDRVERPDRRPDEGGIGDRSAEIEALLKSYKNVYYFSGHSHMGLGGENCKAKEGYASFEYEDGLTLINFPSLACKNHHGETHALGIGMQLEVYDDKVVIRPRSFMKHKWNKAVVIKDGKPYMEQKL